MASSRDLKLPPPFDPNHWFCSGLNEAAAVLIRNKNGDMQQYEARLVNGDIVALATPGPHGKRVSVEDRCGGRHAAHRYQV